MSPTYAEVDVRVARIVVRVHPAGVHWSVPNDVDGVRTLVDRLRLEAPTLVVVDTPARDSSVVPTLTAAGLPVAVSDARRRAGAQCESL